MREWRWMQVDAILINLIGQTMMPTRSIVRIGILQWGFNLLPRLVLVNSPLYDSRVCIKQAKNSKNGSPLSRAKANVRRDVDARCQWMRKKQR